MIRSFLQSFPSNEPDIHAVFDASTLQIAWDLVFFGTDSEMPNAHLGIGPKVAIKILTVSKSFFDMMMTSPARQTYWERNLRIRFENYLDDYKFKVSFCSRSLFLNYAKEEFEIEIAKRESFKARKNYIEILVDYFDQKKGSINSNAMYRLLEPIKDFLSDSNANFRAQYYLAKCYDDIEFEGADEENAFFFFERAAKQGHLKAQEHLDRLGGDLEDFVEIPFEFNTQRDYLETDILESLQNMIDKVTTFCMKVYKTKNKFYSKEEIFDLLEPLIDHLTDTKLSADAYYLLGCCYADGIYMLKDDDVRFKYFTLSANLGNSHAQYELGICYRNAFGVEKNNNEAFKWISLSANAGNTEAQCLLGLYYEHGIGVLKDKKEGFKWTELSANAGYAEAQYNLGLYYDEGTCVLKDQKEVFKWMTLSANSGFAEAQCYVGRLYQGRLGVKKDESKMLKLMRLSATQENTNAQYNLSGYYEDGEGVEQDLKKAFKWMKRSAINGDNDARHALSMFYKEGKGTIKDDEKAFLWMKLSSDEDEEAFAKDLKALKQKHKVPK